MESHITGIQDTDILILSLLDDNSLDKISKSNKNVRLLCHEIWFIKLKSLYPDIPFNDKEYNKFLYLYLKYNRWDDIIQWSENNLILQNWIIHNQVYEKYFIDEFRKYMKLINHLRNNDVESYLIKNELLSFLRFIYTHRLFIKNHLMLAKTVIQKIEEIESDDLQDIKNLYLQQFNNYFID